MGSPGFTHEREHKQDRNNTPSSARRSSVTRARKARQNSVCGEAGTGDGNPKIRSAANRYPNTRIMTSRQRAKTARSPARMAMRPRAPSSAVDAPSRANAAAICADMVSRSDPQPAERSASRPNEIRCRAVTKMAAASRATTSPSSRLSRRTCLNPLCSLR
jgi:hypothetical protein